MEEIALRLINISIMASFLSIVVMILRIFTRKAPKWTRLVLWAIVGIRLIFPFSIESRVSPVPNTEVIPQDFISKDTHRLQIDSGFPMIDEKVNNGYLENYYEGVSVPILFGRKIMKSFSYVWIVGVAAMLCIFLGSFLNLKRKVSVKLPLSVKGYERLRIYVSDGTASPFVLGIFRPAIYLPSALMYEKAKEPGREEDTGAGIGSELISEPELGEESKLKSGRLLKTKSETGAEIGKEPYAGLEKMRFGSDDGRLKMILEHERSHIRHLDQIWKLFGYLILTVYWFNPLLWISYLLFCRDLEFACDERVLGKLDKDEIAVYSRTLLTCCARNHTLAVTPLAFGEISVKDRIRSVLAYKKPTARVLAAAIVVCVIAGAFLMTNRISAKTEAEGAVQDLSAQQNADVATGEKWQEEDTAAKDVRQKEDTDARDVRQEEDTETKDVRQEEDTETKDVRQEEDTAAKDSRQNQDAMGISIDFGHLSFGVPEGYSLRGMDFDVNFINGEGYLFEKEGYGLERNEDMFCPQEWYSFGGIAIFENDSENPAAKILWDEDGKMIYAGFGGNHLEHTEPEALSLENPDFQAMISEYSFDLYTAAAWEEHLAKHPDAEYEESIAEYYYIFLGRPDSPDKGICIFLNRRYFTREYALTLAEAVRLLP